MSKNYTYQDGSEAILLDFFSQNPSSAETEKFYLKHYENWPLRYHLDPSRQGLLDWFPFKPSSSLLEIGAGCGALTGLFIEHCSHVTALEPDQARFAVLSARHQHLSPNNCFLQKTIQELPSSTKKFDYITLIGVLEYAGQTNTSASELIAQAKCFLKKTGTLIIAIENKLGLKYFAGEPEDHTGKSFDSLNDYPSSPQVQTFSFQELSQLLQKNNFSSLEYYFPFPDYKLPQTVIHQSQFEQKNSDQSTYSLNQLFDFTKLSPETQQSFSGSATAFQLQKNSLLSAFMPSFLVLART